VAASTDSESGDESLSAALCNEASLPARAPSWVFCCCSAAFLVPSAVNGTRSCTITASRMALKSMLLNPLSVIAAMTGSP
jgi:hypothetical protein